MTGRRALAGITIAAAAALAAGAATAQVPYQIGDDRGDVTVDMGLLESLGPLPTVPEMLRPGTPVAELGYDPRIGSLAAIQPSRGATAQLVRPGTPSLGVDTAPAPDWLRRPDAPRYAPVPETLGRPAAPRGTAPTLSQPTLSQPTLSPPAAEPRVAAPRAAAPTLRPPEPKAPAARPAAASAPSTSAPPPPRPEPKAPAPAAAPAAPPPPEPKAPSATAEAAPRTPPAPAVRAPEPPKPPALPATTAPAKDAPAEPDKPTQVAAATTGPAPASPAPSASAQGAAGDVVRVPFDPNQSALPPAAASGLDAVIARLRQDDTLRVQLLAYADGDDDNANKARRLSLSRALAVRAYLIDKQIQSTRMDVRALGNRTKESPKDRVDVVLVSR